MRKLNSTVRRRASLDYSTAHKELIQRFDEFSKFTAVLRVADAYKTNLLYIQRAAPKVPE